MAALRTRHHCSRGPLVSAVLAFVSGRRGVAHRTGLLADHTTILEAVKNLVSGHWLDGIGQVGFRQGLRQADEVADRWLWSWLWSWLRTGNGRGCGLRARYELALKSASLKGRQRSLIHCCTLYVRAAHMASARTLASPRTRNRRSPSFSFSQAFTNSATADRCLNAA